MIIQECKNKPKKEKEKEKKHENTYVGEQI